MADADGERNAEHVQDAPVSYTQLPIVESSDTNLRMAAAEAKALLVDEIVPLRAEVVAQQQIRGIEAIAQHHTPEAKTSSQQKLRKMQQEAPVHHGADRDLKIEQLKAQADQIVRQHAAETSSQHEMMKSMQDQMALMAADREALNAEREAWKREVQREKEAGETARKEAEETAKKEAEQQTHKADTDTLSRQNRHEAQQDAPGADRDLKVEAQQQTREAETSSQHEMMKSMQDQIALMAADREALNAEREAWTREVQREKEAGETARKEAEETAKKKAEEKAKTEAEEKAKTEAEEKAKTEAEEKAAEEQAKKETGLKISSPCLLKVRWGDRTIRIATPQSLEGLHATVRQKFKLNEGDEIKMVYADEADENEQIEIHDDEDLSTALHDTSVLMLQDLNWMSSISFSTNFHSKSKDGNDHWNEEKAQAAKNEAEVQEQAKNGAEAQEAQEAKNEAEETAAEKEAEDTAAEKKKEEEYEQMLEDSLVNGTTFHGTINPELKGAMHEHGISWDQHQRALSKVLLNNVGLDAEIEENVKSVIEVYRDCSKPSKATEVHALKLLAHFSSDTLKAALEKAYGARFGVTKLHFDPLDNKQILICYYTHLAMGGKLDHKVDVEVVLRDNDGDLKRLQERLTQKYGFAPCLAITGPARDRTVGADAESSSTIRNRSRKIVPTNYDEDDETSRIIPRHEAKYETKNEPRSNQIDTGKVGRSWSDVLEMPTINCAWPLIPYASGHISAFLLSPVYVLMFMFTILSVAKSGQVLYAARERVWLLYRSSVESSWAKRCCCRKPSAIKSAATRGVGQDMRETIQKAFVQTIECWHDLLVWFLTVVLFVPVRFMFKHNYLGSDVQSRTGGVSYFLLVMALPPVMVKILGADPELQTSVAFFFLAMLLLPVLGLIFRQKQNDLATTIYDPRGEAGCNTENAIVLVGYLVECLQLCAFSFDPTIPYPEGIKVPFRAFLLDFGLSGFVTFYVAFGLVAVWLFLIAGLQTHENAFVDVQEFTIPWMSKCRRTHKTFKLPLLRYMLLLLGGGAYLVILKSMMSTLHCVKNPLTDQYVLDDSITYSVGGEVLFNANEQLHVECWHGAHRTYAVLSFYALIFFFPTACLAPYGTDRRFIPHELDIRLVPIYVFANNVLKSLLTGLVMFNRQNQQLALCCTLGISFLQMVLNSVYKPCCIPWVNTVRMSSYAIAAWTSLTSLYALHNGREYGAAAWRPVFFLFAGWSAILLSVVWMERRWLYQILNPKKDTRERSSGKVDLRAVERICKPSMKQRVHIERTLFEKANIRTLEHILNRLETVTFKASSGETALKLVRSGVLIKSAELLVDTTGVGTVTDQVNTAVTADCVKFLTKFFTSLVVHTQGSSLGSSFVSGSDRVSWLLYSEQVFSLTQLIEKNGGMLIGKTTEDFVKSYWADLFEKEDGLFEGCRSGGFMALVLELFVHSSQKKMDQVLDALLEFIHFCLSWCAASRLQVVKSAEGKVLRALLHESQSLRETASKCLFLLTGCLEGYGYRYQPTMFYAQLAHVAHLELDSAIHTIATLAKHHLKRHQHDLENDNIELSTAHKIETTFVYIVDGISKGRCGKLEQPVLHLQKGQTYTVLVESAAIAAKADGGQKIGGKHLRCLGFELCSFMKAIVQHDIVFAVLSRIDQHGADDLESLKDAIEAITELLKCYFSEKRSFNATNSEPANKCDDLLSSLQKCLGNTESKLICITAYIIDSAMDHLDKLDKNITIYCLKALLNQQINTREIMVAGFAQHGNGASNSKVSESVFKFVARIFGARTTYTSDASIHDSQGKKLEAGIIPIVQAFSNQSPLHQKSCIPLLTAILEPLGQEATSTSEVAEVQISHFVRKKQVRENYQYAAVTGSLLFGLPIHKFWSESIEEELILRFVLLKQRRYDEHRTEKKAVCPAKISNHQKWRGFASEIMTRKLRQEFAQLLKQRFDTALTDQDPRLSTRAVLSPRQRIFKREFTLITRNKVGYKGSGTATSNYHPGIISQVHPNGTYDITYDHGVHETNVPPENVRSRQHVIVCHRSRVDRFDKGKPIEASADVHAHLAGVIASCEAWVRGAAFLVKQKAFLHLLRSTQCLNSLTNKDSDVPLKGVLGLNNSLPELFERVGYKQLSACESINIDSWQLKPSHLKNEKKLETLVSGVLTERSEAQVAQEWQKARSKCPCEKANVACTCGHQQLRILTQLRHVAKLVPGVSEESKSTEESMHYVAQDNGELCASISEQFC
jgi:hypothetical protein